MASTTLAAGLSEWERAELIRERRSAVDRELEGKQMREMAEVGPHLSACLFTWLSYYTVAYSDGCPFI